MQTFTFTFTPDQVNELVACMQKGPFDQVNKMLQELRRQMEAQQAPAAPAPQPPANGEERPQVS
jgi:hypothetical protein